MSKLRFDVTDVKRPRRSLRSRPARDEPPEEEHEPGSFEQRVIGQRRDLIGIMEDGVPEQAYVPGSADMLVVGKRHLVAAPPKSAKSFGFGTIMGLDICLAGGRVAILDRENGAEVYAQRLLDVCEARGLDHDQRARVRDNLDYFEFPSLKRVDGDDLAAVFEGYALVIYDSSRMFLSQWGLKEDLADDYAKWMELGVQPLFLAGVATLILDNTGHGDQTRGRGSAAKGDLNEIMFSLKVEEPFDLNRRGRVRARVELSRFGTSGDWALELGGGHYGSWASTKAQPAPDAGAFPAAVLAVLGEADGPLGMDRIIAAVRGRGVAMRTDRARAALDALAADAESPVAKTRAGFALQPRPGVGRGGHAPTEGRGGA